jgi:peroxiredoxin Q/BCP
MAQLKVGDKAPAIKAKDQNGNDISLSQYKGKKIILYFYPKDDTPGCTKEACSFRDSFEDLLEHNYQVIGVSVDSEKSHQKFIEKYSLPFPLIADADKKVVEDYGVWGLKKFMGREYMGINRVTFVISEKGIIERVITKVDTNNAAGQILEGE